MARLGAGPDSGGSDEGEETTRRLRGDAESDPMNPQTESFDQKLEREKREGTIPDERPTGDSSSSEPDRDRQRSGSDPLGGGTRTQTSTPDTEPSPEPKPKPKPEPKPPTDNNQQTTSTRPADKPSSRIPTSDQATAPVERPDRQTRLNPDSQGTNPAGQGVEQYGRTDRYVNYKGDTVTLREAARRFEQSAAEKAGVDPERTAVMTPQTQGDSVQFQLVYTQQGEALATAEALRDEYGVGSDVISSEGGDVVVDTEGLGESIMTRPGAPGPTARGERLSMGNSGGESRVADRINAALGGFKAAASERRRNTQDPRATIESQLETRTGVNLDPETDIRFSEEREDGQTVVSGTLTDEGRKRVAVESAPLQGTPFEVATEFGAGVDYEFDTFRERNRDTFNRVLPNYEEDFNRLTPDSEEILGFAGAAAPFALAEPTPAGEIGVAGAALVAGVVGAGATLGASLRQGAPQAETAEITVPSSGEFFEQNEAGLPSRPGFIVDQVGIPDPTSTSFDETGVPESGIQITPGESTDVVSSTELTPGEATAPTELGLPEAETTGSNTFGGPMQARPIGMQRGRQRSKSDDTTFISGEDLAVGGGMTPLNRGEGLDIGETRSLGGTRFVGRRANEDRLLSDPFEKFLSFGGGVDTISEPLDLLDTSQTPQASIGETSLPRAGPLAGSAQDATDRLSAAQQAETTQGPDLMQSPDTRSRARDLAGSQPDILDDTALSQPLALDETGLATPAMQEPTAEAPGLGTPNLGYPTAESPVDVPEYWYDQPTSPSSRRRRPLFELGSGDSRSRARGGDESVALLERELINPLEGADTTSGGKSGGTLDGLADDLGMGSSRGSKARSFIEPF